VLLVLVLMAAVSAVLLGAPEGAGAVQGSVEVPGKESKVGAGVGQQGSGLGMPAGVGVCVWGFKQVEVEGVGGVEGAAGAATAAAAAMGVGNDVMDAGPSACKA